MARVSDGAARDRRRGPLPSFGGGGGESAERQGVPREPPPLRREEGSARDRRGAGLDSESFSGSGRRRPARVPPRGPPGGYGGGPRQTGCGAGLGKKYVRVQPEKGPPGRPRGGRPGGTEGAPRQTGCGGWTWHKNVRVHFQPEEARPVYASRGGGLWPVSRATSPLDLAQSSPGPPSGWLAGVSRARRQPLEATPYGPRKGQSRGALRVRPPRTA